MTRDKLGAAGDQGDYMDSFLGQEFGRVDELPLFRGGQEGEKNLFRSVGLEPGASVQRG